MKQIAVIYLVHIFYTPSNSLQHLAHDQVGGGHKGKTKLPDKLQLFKAIFCMGALLC